MYVHAQAPVRIGIAGGGTDLPAWTKERTGYCLSLAIDTYTHAVAITRPDRQVVASYRHLDHAASATEIANGLIRESALLHGWEDGFEVHTLSEVSSLGSGLGVSSSIAVVLAACFSKMRQISCGINEVNSKKLLAEQAWTVEIDRLRRPIGRQDHMAAAHGGLRLYRFEGGEANVERSFSEDDVVWAAKYLSLLRLPDGHDSRAILAGVRVPEQVMVAADSVAVAIRAIEEKDQKMLGEAIGMGQRSKMAIPGAVPPGVAEVVSRVEAQPGVYGCKVAGAGGGGHVVVVCEPEVADAVSAATWLPLQHVAPDFHGVRSDGWP